MNTHSLFYENSTQNIRAVKVETLDDYLLRVYFSNKEIKIYDVKPLLNYKMFVPIIDKKKFAKAKVKYNTVIWNENIDIDPEDLYWSSVSEAVR